MESDLPIKPVELRFDVYQKLQILASQNGCKMEDMVFSLVQEKIESMATPEEKVRQHDRLKDVAIQYIKIEFGFTDAQIGTEFSVPGHRVDVVGISDTLKVAVEVGHAPMARLLVLHKYFDHVIWIPYWLKVLTGEEDWDEVVKHKISTIIDQEISISRGKAHRESIKRMHEAQDHISAVKEAFSLMLSECTDKELKAKVGLIAEKIYSAKTQLLPSDFKRASDIERDYMPGNESYEP